ncbi:hypothetical protein QFW77_17870 [Luteimonas sp. RD2P54]|uniref:Uncharacterized protein n=1 Tax=Luteimonas endophytica TaxID=3042023 RepID=A0ABT6JE41_9GAMM|nr:hypothetical protein [Luteimonas endophytica]MDH5824840.1 hypothetical protein [Luteimonas endophytica]
MKTTASCAAILAALLAGTAAAHVAQPNTISMASVDRCPGGPEWLESLRAERRAAGPRPVATNPALRDRLIALDRDRSAADYSQAAAEAAAAADAAAAAALAAIRAGDSGSAPSVPESTSPPATPREASRLSRLQALVDLQKPPRVAEIGPSGMNAVFSVLERIASQPQARLRLGEALLRSGDPGLDRASRRRAAELVDRALHDLGEPQRYGTLFDIQAQGRAILRQPVEAEAGLEARRAGLGLVPLALETCVRSDSESDMPWSLFFGFL